MLSLEKKWQPTPVFLPGKFHGQRNLAGYSPLGRKESATTEHISTDRVIGVSVAGQVYFKNKFREKNHICGFQRRGAGDGVWGNWMKAVERNELPVIRRISTMDVTYNMIHITDTVVGYI